LFIKHIGYNLKGFPGTFYRLLSIDHNKIFLPNNKFFHTIEKFLLLITCGWYLFYIRGIQWVTIKLNYTNHKNLLVYFGIYSLPGIISGVIFSNSYHYLLLPCILFSLIIAIFVIKDSNHEKRLSSNQLLLLGIVVIGFTPTPEIIYGFDYNYSPTKRANTIRFIESLNLEKEVYILEERNDMAVFLGKNFHEVLSYKKSTDFNEFITQTGINMVIVSNRLQKDPRFKHDKEWDMFLEHYESYGYTKVVIPNVNDIKLLIHKSLIRSN